MWMTLAPSQIRFMQDTISWKFRGKKGVNDTIDDIIAGRTSVSLIPCIEVAERDGKYYSLDNRRLYMFRVLEKMGKLESIEVRRSVFNSGQFTTNNDGYSIRMRGRRGYTRPHTFEGLLIPPKPITTTITTENVKASTENESVKVAEVEKLESTENELVTTAENEAASSKETDANSNTDTEAAKVADHHVGPSMKEQKVVSETEEYISVKETEKSQEFDSEIAVDIISATTATSVGENPGRLYPQEGAVAGGKDDDNGPIKRKRKKKNIKTKEGSLSFADSISSKKVLTEREQRLLSITRKYRLLRKNDRQLKQRLIKTEQENDKRRNEIQHRFTF